MTTVSKIIMLWKKVSIHKIVSYCHTDGGTWTINYAVNWWQDENVWLWIDNCQKKKHLKFKQDKTNWKYKEPSIVHFLEQ